MLIDYYLNLLLFYKKSHSHRNFSSAKEHNCTLMYDFKLWELA